MTSFLLYSLLAIASLAIAFELLATFARDLFIGLCGIGNAEAASEKVKADIAEATRKLEATRGSLLILRRELHRADEALAAVEADIEKRETPREILIFPVGNAAAASDQQRFRAVLTKDLDGKPEPSQQEVWRKPCFLETWAYGAEDALRRTREKFPAAHGYSIAAFEPVETAQDKADAASKIEKAA